MIEKWGTGLQGHHDRDTPHFNPNCELPLLASLHGNLRNGVAAGARIAAIATVSTSSISVWGG